MPSSCPSVRSYVLWSRVPAAVATGGSRGAIGSGVASAPAQLDEKDARHDQA